jgi:hypothetical protein
MCSHQQEIQCLRDTHQSELDQLRLAVERSDSNHQQERDRLQAEVDGLRNSNENLRTEKEQVHKYVLYIAGWALNVLCASAPRREYGTACYRWRPAH